MPLPLFGFGHNSDRCENLGDSPKAISLTSQLHHFGNDLLLLHVGSLLALHPFCAIRKTRLSARTGLVSWAQRNAKTLQILLDGRFCGKNLSGNFARIEAFFDVFLLEETP